jgi:hypothetical protein
LTKSFPIEDMVYHFHQNIREATRKLRHPYFLP